MTELPTKDIEARTSKVNQTPRSQNYQNVNIGPPLPAKQQGWRNQGEIGYQTLPSSFRSSHKTHHFNGHEGVKHHHAMTSELEHCVIAAKKRMDDSAIGGSETDSSYDDVDAQSLRETNSGTTESNGCLSPPYNVISNLSDMDKKLGSCNSLGLLEGQLSSKGYHNMTMKEVEELKNLVHQLSIKVKVH